MTKDQTGRLRAVSLVLAILAGGVHGAELDVEQLAQQVRIHRDAYGVPHVLGQNDASVVFGFGYAQAEDYFWQVEDAYILALGRYAEVHGPKGLNSDLLNRAFEIVPRSRRDFAALDAATQQLYAAFVAGINYYLETHTEVRPRLIQFFEPWHVLAYHRHVGLELCFRFVGLEGSSYLPRRNPHVWTAAGSNGWAISGERTRSGGTMLLANPHMPWFGFAQMIEAHLHCEAGPDGPGWNFIGAGFYGSPTLAMGHNERLGWTLVSNEPDIADTWRESFSDPENPLAYRYAGGWRTAQVWQETLEVRKSRGLEARSYEFRKTHHGPIVAREDRQTMLAAKISGLFHTVPMRQWLPMIKSQNLAEFRQALSMMQILYMNVIYADVDGNIQYFYTGRVPRRNPTFDWSQPVDGSNPATEWLGFHNLEDLPQVLNPAAGFVQNCNSTPLITSDTDNPQLDDFPSYMIGDRDQYKRRALRSLEILRKMKDVTWEDWRQAAFDTEVYWARHELPKYADHFQVLQQEHPELAKRVEPYWRHLLAWDAQITPQSTAATLCHAWYEQLYGRGYPGEQMRELYTNKPQKQWQSLARAAERLRAMHGSWKVPYGEVYRSQRQPRLVDLVDARFHDNAPSLPSLGGHGPMGVIFTQYYTPSLEIPWVISQRRRYGLVGTSYLAAYEFAPGGVRGASLVPFGTSGDPSSAHYFDQAPLLAEKRLKPELFTKQQVLEGAVRSYHPGER
ncbi:MAG: penicillin acylase family protein [Pirellulales bacterium]|nr:penicillin acylase family protein [Pirellulales bacterium]